MGRRHLLTDEGDLLLSYAKSILRLHDEMLQRLASPDVEGTVVLGTPDLYAAFVLPAILNRFRKAFPRVQVELRCELSTPLVGLVRRRNRSRPGHQDGRLLRRESRRARTADLDGWHRF